MSGAFGVKPSDAHVVWTSERGGDDSKQFDFEYLKLWAAHFGVDYEVRDRSLPERGIGSPRHVCVFHWERIDPAGAGERPRTFVEIDATGTLRFRGWSREATLDIEELRLDGTTLRLRTTAGGRRSLDADRLAKRPSANTV